MSRFHKRTDTKLNLMIPLLFEDVFTPCLHMDDLTKPHKKYAGAGENCNIAISVIFYPVIKTL